MIINQPATPGGSYTAKHTVLVEYLVKTWYKLEGTAAEAKLA